MSLRKIMKTPNWNTWSYIPDVSLLEGVALSLNIEPPDDYDLITGANPFIGVEEYKRRLLIAERNHGERPGLDLVTINAAYPELSRVPLQGFAAWACSIGWEVPEAFAEIGKQWKDQTKTKAEVDNTGTLGKRAESTYLNIIGAMLDLMLSKSPGGQPYSTFASQDAIISALLAHHEGKPGIAERTLEAKFAAARRNLTAT